MVMNISGWQRIARLALALAVAGGAGAAALQAQQDGTATGQVRGVVRDTIGVGIDEAIVTLTDGNARVWIVLSDPQGRYVVNGLPAGTYAMTVTSPGFADFRSAVDVRGGTPASVIADLKIAFTESIEVRQVLSDPRRNPSTVILSARDIALLPAEETLFLERLAQLAGAARSDDVAIYVDGFREYKRVPLRDTIDVIRINSNPFSAEFGDRSARRIEISTKPGADTYHGSARMQFRDSRLNARAPMEPDQAPMRYRNANGYVQGPISKGAGFLLYGGVWQRDETATIRSTIVDPQTFAASEYRHSLAAPLQQTSVLGKLDFKLFDQRMNATFARNAGRHRNRGLESGFAMPEHAYDTTTTENIGRLWWSTIGKRSFNDVRVQFVGSTTASNAQTSGAAIDVLNAFNAGGNQQAMWSRSMNAVQVSDTFTVQAGRHLIKAGGLVDMARHASVDRSGFGGTFTFGAGLERDAAGNPVLDTAGMPIAISPLERYRRTLLRWPGYAPSQFSIVRGDPALGLTQWNAAAFVVDDWTISKSLSLSMGVRQELQSNIGSLAVAPRAYLSWVPDESGSTVVRVGSGTFFMPVDADLMLQAEKLNGARQEQIVVSEPAFFPDVPSAGSLAAVPPAMIYAKAAGLRMPQVLRASVSVERRLPAGLWAVAEYANDRGSHLLRSRVLDGSPRVLQFESTGRSSEQSVLLALRGRMRTSTFYANYTRASRRGDTDGAYTVLSDPGDPAQDYGVLATDRPHTFSAGATLVFPRDLYVTPFVTYSSGRPFNITTGVDANGDTVFVERPAFAADGDPSAIETPFGLFTPNVRPGDRLVPRNFGRDPGQAAFNLSVSKMFRKSLGLTLDIDNVLNRSRLTSASGVLTSPLFGVPNQSLNGRRFEFGARYDF